MFIVLLLNIFTNLALSTTPKMSTRVLKYQTFKVPAALNISDRELMVTDLTSFVRHIGDRNHTALRIKPEYYDPSETEMKQTIISLMQQSIYATQDRIKHLDNILDKYADDAAFRASFVFSKLDQLEIDMRRIYTIAVREKEGKTVLHNINYYTHIAKRNVDVTYIVEYMIDFHNRNLEMLKTMNLGAVAPTLPLHGLPLKL